MMENDLDIPQNTAESGKSSVRKRNAIVFTCVVCIWLAIDLATKAYFDTNYQPGDVISGSILGLFRLELVHNTGAAWGLFGDSTFFLGISSIFVCIILLVYLFILMPGASLGETIGIALVFAGGFGNAMGRFFSGYVTDFISVTFMSFPVFNVADIGVTCGFIIFLISMLVSWSKSSKRLVANGQDTDEGVDNPENQEEPKEPESKEE